MRNLSLEAAQAAIRTMATQYTSLGDSDFRKALSSEEKQWIFDQLFIMASIYEQQLVQGI